jgi:mutator protein MutT
MRVRGLTSTCIFPFLVSGALALDRAPIAAGIVFENDGRVLLVKRSKDELNYGGHWSLPGGKAEAGETPEEAAIREAREEVGYLATDPMVCVSEVETPTGMVFHTFHCVVKDRFTPTLNDEHTAYRWVKPGNLPEPLHPQVEKTLNGLKIENRLDRLAERRQDVDIAEFFGIAMDRAPDGIDPRVDKMNRGGLPYDNKSVRTKDTDGRLHVQQSNISKAGVNPYLGSEIPNHEKLGLDPKKIYKLLRHPDELKKAAETFNRQPLLSRHVPVSADDHQGDIVVGTIGSDAVYEHPYLKNSLTVWTQDGIDAVESDEQKELSSAYHYDADMTPGEYEGAKFDGVMRNIRGNHVALVKTGRAGSDVVVGDEALPNQNGEVKMSKNRMMTRKASVAAGALMVHLRPLIAQDSTIDLGPLMLKAKPGKFTAAKKAIADGLEKILSSGKVKLAQDGDVGEIIESVAELLDLVDGDKTIVDDAEPAALDPNTSIPDATMDAGPAEKAAEYLRSKGVSDEIIAGLAGAMSDAATDEFPDDLKKKDGEESDDDKKKKKEKPAMDQATVTKMITDAVNSTKVSVLKTQREISEARETVRPHVGQLAMDAECAADVFRAALGVMGVEGADDLHADALLPVFTATAAGKKTTATTKTNIAMDAAASKSFAERFPGAGGIKTV